MKQIFLYSPILLLIISSCVPPSYSPSNSKKSTYTLYTTSYNMSLTKVERPAKASSRYRIQKIDTHSDNKNYQFIFEDEMFKVLWRVTGRIIAFSILNKTDHSIKIPWDEAAFIDQNASSHRVMHSGVKYTDRESPQAPSIIDRKASLEDIVFPTDYVDWNSGSWTEKPFFPEFDFHGPYSQGTYPAFDSFEAVMKSNVGKSIQVRLPLQIEDVVNDYIFTFTVDSVSCSETSWN